MTAQWLVPAIVWCVLRLADPDTERRQTGLTAALLGFLVTLQFHLGAEVLLLTALTLGLFCAAYAAAAWHDARPPAAGAGRGLGLAGGAGGGAAGVPAVAAVRRAAARARRPVPVRTTSAWTLRSLTAHLAAVARPATDAAAPLATDAAEYNAFFGVPLLLVVARGDAVAVAAPGRGGLRGRGAPCMVRAGARPAGRRRRRADPVPAPFALHRRPARLSAALPTRFALAAVPLFAVLHRAGGRHRRWRAAGTGRWVRLACRRRSSPRSRRWRRRRCPPTTGRRAAVLHRRRCWRGVRRRRRRARAGAAARAPATRTACAGRRRPTRGFALPEGSFIGPYGGGGAASLGTYPRPTSLLLAAGRRHRPGPGRSPTPSGPTARADARSGAPAASCWPRQRNDAAARARPWTRPARLPAPQRVADVWTCGASARRVLAVARARLIAAGRDLGERLARLVQLAQRRRPRACRNSASVQSTTTRILRFRLRDPAHVVRAVHEPRRQARAP